MSSRAWIAVASAEHVGFGRAAGFMQVCHGRAGPLRRIAPGERVIYYSPTGTFGGKDRLQAFTAIGSVREAAPYQVSTGADFHPWRRDVDWQSGVETAIRPLLSQLSFTRDNPGWGFQLRFGLFPIPGEDADLIDAAMNQAILQPLLL